MASSGAFETWVDPYVHPDGANPATSGSGTAERWVDAYTPLSVWYTQAAVTSGTADHTSTSVVSASGTVESNSGADHTSTSIVVASGVIPTNPLDPGTCEAWIDIYTHSLWIPGIAVAALVPVNSTADHTSTSVVSPASLTITFRATDHTSTSVVSPVVESVALRTADHLVSSTVDAHGNGGTSTGEETTEDLLLLKVLKFF